MDNIVRGPMGLFELLGAEFSIRRELRRLKFLEDNNSLTANLSEVYFCHAYNTPRRKAHGYDADIKGVLYQIKGALITTKQTGSIYGYNGPDSAEAPPFHHLAIVELTESYRVYRAALLSSAELKRGRWARYNKRTEDWSISLTKKFWREAVLIDIKDDLVRASIDLDQLGYVPEYLWEEVPALSASESAEEAQRA